MGYTSNLGKGIFNSREYPGPNGQRMVESTIIDAHGQAHTTRFEIEAVNNLPAHAAGIIEMKDGSQFVVMKDGSVRQG